MIILPRGVEYALSILMGVLCAAALCLALRACESISWGCDEVCSVALAVRRLQPAADERRAQRLAEIFVEAGRETSIDPLLLLAISMRESSLHPAVESLTRRGSVGELGLMQVHPRNRAALAMRPADCDEQLSTARCQITTGARWLAYSRQDCPGSTWRWIVAYGSGRCVTEATARADRLAAIAASYYLRAGGTRW